MPRYTHRDGDRAASRITVPGVGSVPIEDGVFECDPDADVHERLVDLGHTPLEGDDPPDEPVEEGDAEADDGDGEAAEEVPPAGAYTEDQLVAMSYDEKRTLASQYDHIDGRSSGDKLTEELIKQRREEVDG